MSLVVAIQNEKKLDVVVLSMEVPSAYALVRKVPSALVVHEKHPRTNKPCDSMNSEPCVRFAHTNPSSATTP